MQELTDIILQLSQEELELQGDKLLELWCTAAESNGIKQHSPEWYEARGHALGGSSQGTLQGINPYQSVMDMMLERVGVKPFVPDIKPQWGNLLEDVLAEFVAHDCKCRIQGDDLYIFGPPGTSYSPDGLAICDLANVKFYNGGTAPGFDDEAVEPPPTGVKLVLLEFKCPFVRIPGGYVPPYYQPQMEMGMDLLKIPTVSVFCEAVLRRCSWDELSMLNAYCDKTLTRPPPRVTVPLACGVVGLYVRDRAACVAMLQDYCAELQEYGCEANDYICNDLGACTPGLFKKIMMLYDSKAVGVKYFRLIYEESGLSKTVNGYLAEMRKWCKDNSMPVLGLMPLKVLRADYHLVKPVKYPCGGYLDRWRPQMVAIIAAVGEIKKLPIEERPAAVLKWCIEAGYEGVPELGAASNCAGFDDE